MIQNRNDENMHSSNAFSEILHRQSKKYIVILVSN